MFKNLFKKSYTSINTNDHGSAGVSRAESAKADKRAAEAAQEKPEKIPSRPTAMTPESLRSLWRKCNKCEKPILVQDVKDNLYVCPRCGGYMVEKKGKNTRFVCASKECGYSETAE